MQNFMYGPAGQATDAGNVPNPPAAPVTSALSTTETINIKGKNYVLGFGAGAILGLAAGWLLFKR